MSNAQKDENGVSSLIAVSNTNGQTVLRLQADPITHHLQLTNGTTGTNFGPKNAHKDDNDVSTMIAVSSGDGQTPVTLYTDSSGYLLVQST